MNHWYLVSSLPYLRFGEKPSMDAAAFRTACVGWLTEHELDVIDAVLANREPPAGAATDWWNAEIQLCDAVVRARAKLRSIDASRFLKPHEGFSATIEKMVADAFIRSDPAEREMELDRTRWMLAEERAVSDPFGFSTVLAFAVKVRIVERWASLDEEAGKEKVEELILTATAENPETGIEV